MINKKTRIFIDSWTMFKRCLLISLRNPETLLVATIVPFLLMFLFGNIFGNITNIGDYNYIDYIIPGIVLQSIGQSSQYSAMNIASDMSKGMIDRFRSMSISKSAIIIGHTGAGVIRNSITSIIILFAALILGFRPLGNFLDWITLLILLMLVNTAISLLAVLCGLISKSVEGSSALMLPLFILPFISSGFAPVDTMSEGIKWFATNQPMTPIIDSMRALLLNLPLNHHLWVALGWSIGIIIIAFTISLQLYKRKSN